MTQARILRRSTAKAWIDAKIIPWSACSMIAMLENIHSLVFMIMTGLENLPNPNLLL